MKKTITFTFLAMSTMVMAADFSVVHNQASGESIFTLPDKPGLYNIYRSSKAIGTELPPGVKCIYSRLASNAVVPPYKVSGSGNYYYALTSSDTSVRSTGIVKTFGPVAETDTTPPSKPKITGSYTEGFPCVSWQKLPLDNPEEVVEFRIYKADNDFSSPEKGVLIGTVKNQRHAIMSWTDHTITAASPSAFYRVATVDQSGNLSELSEPFHANLRPDLALQGSSRIATNTDLSASKMYPVPGETIKLQATVRNIGAKDSQATTVRISEFGKTVAVVALPVIPAGKTFTINWQATGEKAGEYHTLLEIDPENRLNDANRANNHLEIQRAVVPKTVYFLWYGNVKQLPYSNSGQCQVSDIPEWKRRGGIAGAGVGAKGEKDKLIAMYEDRLKQGYDGVFIDEIHMGGEEAQTMVKALPELRKRNPKAFIALWTIGEDTVPEVAELVKTGVVNLLMLEVYLRPNDNFGAHDKAIANMRKYGIADKTVIGLVTHKEWDNWVGGKQQTEYVLRQMRYIRRTAPEMPGFAFWSDDAHPGVIEAVDAEYYKLFVPNN